jgi:hypothetical protein
MREGEDNNGSKRKEAEKLRDGETAAHALSTIAKPATARDRAICAVHVQLSAHTTTTIAFPLNARSTQAALNNKKVPPRAPRNLPAAAGAGAAAVGARL